MFYIWLGIVVLLTFVELTTANLVTIWFVTSAIAALFTSLVIDNFLFQFGVFVILGIILLITTRPILVKLLLKNKNEKTNIDRIIGMKGLIIKDVPKNGNGEIKVDGKIWFAYSDEEIKVNTYATVLEINGTKLKVEGEK